MHALTLTFNSRADIDHSVLYLPFSRIRQMVKIVLAFSHMPSGYCGSAAQMICRIADSAVENW